MTSQSSEASSVLASMINVDFHNTERRYLITRLPKHNTNISTSPYIYHQTRRFLIARSSHPHAYTQPASPRHPIPMLYMIFNLIHRRVQLHLSHASYAYA